MSSESAKKLLARDVAKNLSVSVPILYRWISAFPQAEPAEPDCIWPPSRALEFSLLFDLLTGRSGKLDQAKAFKAEVETISRTVTGR